MLRAVVGYVLAVPLSMLVFWFVGGMLQPPPTATPLISLLFGVVYFGPLMLLFSTPGLMVLVGWALAFRMRAWFIGSAVAGALVLMIFAYASNVMCRVRFLGPDCWGNISFQLTQKSPFVSEYGTVLWATVLCSLVFWLLLARQPATNHSANARSRGDA